jgi:hypothetical protein
MNSLAIIIGLSLYFAFCIYLAKLHVKIREYIRGKKFLEIIVVITVIAIYIPFASLFPALLTDYFPIWQQTRHTTIAMVLVGDVVMLYALFKAGPISGT